MERKVVICTYYVFKLLKSLASECTEFSVARISDNWGSRIGICSGWILEIRLFSVFSTDSEYLSRTYPARLFFSVHSNA